MIKTVIFDIGNVLTVYRWKEFFTEFGFSEDIYSRVVQATVKSPAWNEYDRGLMTDEEVLAAFIRNDPEIEEEIKKSLTNIATIVAKCDYAVPWVRELKERGFQVLVLSNFSRKAHEECKDALEFLKDVDGGIMSYQDGLIKPQPEIFKLLLSRYDLKAEECVFIDDMPDNVAASREQGLHTILFQNREQAVKELEAVIAAG